jgi:CDP-diglyceride synthetase
MTAVEARARSGVTIVWALRGLAFALLLCACAHLARERWMQAASVAGFALAATLMSVYTVHAEGRASLGEDMRTAFRWGQLFTLVVLVLQLRLQVFMLWA